MFGLLFATALYFLFWGFNNYYALITFIISYVIASSVFNFIFDKFKYSDINFIRFSQKCVIYFLIFIVIIYILYLFSDVIYCSSPYDNNSNNTNGLGINTNDKTSSDTNTVINVSEDDKYYNFKLHKDVVQHTGKIIVDALDSGVNVVVKNTAVGTATAAAVSTWLKSTSGMAPLPRIGGLAGIAGITAASTKIGVEVGKNIVDYHSSEKPSTFKDNDIPSPKDDQFNISSVLEDTEILNSLLKLLQMSITLNIFTLILIFLFLWIIFNNYIFSHNMDKISRYFPNFVQKNKEFWLSISSGKYILYLFVFITILLIYIILLNIIISSHVITVIGDYIV